MANDWKTEIEKDATAREASLKLQIAAGGRDAQRIALFEACEADRRIEVESVRAHREATLAMQAEAVADQKRIADALEVIVEAIGRWEERSRG